MAVKRYNGTAWVTSAGSQGITYSATAPSTPAQGDIWVSTADVNTFDSLVQTGNRNAIINGDFRINQRAFSSVTTTNTYGFDRWKIFNAGGTVTYTPQNFTLGSPAQAGYESSTFARLVSSGQSASTDYAVLQQPIEGVRTFANSTVTVSFWAKANSGTPKVAVELAQIFGGSGSPSADVNILGGQVTLSTSWARYNVQITVPSISGKTITTNDALNVNLWTSGGTTYNSRLNSLGIQNNTFDFWGVQVEAGSAATPFETRPIGMELALCQRYYARGGNGSPGIFNNTTGARFSVKFAVPMRVAPTISAIAAPIAINPTVSEGQTGSQTAGFAGTAGSGSVTTNAASQINFSGFTSGADGRPTTLLNDCLEFSAEL